MSGVCTSVRASGFSFTAKLDKTNPEGIFIGEYTGVAFGATIAEPRTCGDREERRDTHRTYTLIGARAIILPGVTIGDHCIIRDCGSMVMTNIPSNSLAIGNRARVVERGINTLAFGVPQGGFRAPIRAGTAAQGCRSRRSFCPHDLRALRPPPNSCPNHRKDSSADRIAAVFNEVWSETHETPPPALKDDTVLLESGLDSMGFAVLVMRLDETVGFDPFSASEEIVYPRTFGEFVAFYEKHAVG